MTHRYAKIERYVANLNEKGLRQALYFALTDPQNIKHINKAIDEFSEVYPEFADETRTY